MKKAAVVIICVMLILSFSVAACADEIKAVRHVSTDEKLVALTFDDGPHPSSTPEILSVLGKYDVKATFFVVGENAKNYPDALRMEAAEGHEIANHTYSHKSLAKRDISYVEDEIEKTEDEIMSVCGVMPSLFRPPEGCFTKAVAEAAAKRDYSVILWNIDTRDWEHRKTADIVQNIKRNITPGSIILFHDYISGERHTSDVLEIIIPYLLAEGYEFVTVSELIGKK